MKIRILSILIFISSFAFAQLSAEEQSVVDSLKYIVETTDSDTVRITALNQWDNIIYISDPALDFELNKRVETICEEKLKNTESLDAKSLAFYKRNYAGCLNILGLVYQDQGDYQTSINYHYKSLNCCEEMEDSLCLSRSFNNIGLLHSLQGNHQEALFYYNKKVKIEESIGDEKSLSLVLSNIGRVYFNMDSLEKANDYYQRSLTIRKKLNLESYLADSYNEIAMLYQKWNKLDSILFYYNQSLEVYTNMGYARGISSVNTNLGNYYIQQKNYDKALSYFVSAYAIDTVTKNNEDLANSSLGLFDLYNANGNYKAALEMYQVNMAIKDSVYSDKNSKTMFQQQFRHEYEKKAAADSVSMYHEKELMDAELLASETEAKRQEEQKYFFIGGLFLAVIFGIFVFNRFRITNKQKKLIEEQNKQVEEQRKVLSDKNKELSYKNLQITDSIGYAKRIQKAVLRSKEDFSKCLKDSFIFYRPKDMVSGDFHWFQKIENEVIFTAVDCTGHGVPGAFMSLVGNNLLDKIVVENKVTRPDLILNTLNVELFKRLNEGNSTDLRDGMDLALCTFNLETYKMLFAGAHNPLYIVREGELVELQGDRLHIGNLENTEGKSFTLHEIQLQKEDMIYMFSDGFVDQKGGPKKKKYFYEPFRKLLVEHSTKPLIDQKQILNDTIIDWMGDDMPQLDDMLIIGVRV